MTSILACDSYKPQILRETINRFPLPDVKGKHVFVKPNLVTPPSVWDRQSVTHPRIIEAILEMLRDSGAASLTVGCCGFKGQWDTTVQLMGLDEICSRMGASLICVQEGENYHKYTLQRLDQYMSLFGTKVSDYVLKAEAVINLPKMKVHSMATVTGAIKNMMGVISPKGSMHPNGSSDILHKRLADLFELMNPIVTWSLMDGIVGSEYNEQYGVPKRANVLIAGNNMWSVDCLAAKVMGFSPAKIPYLRYIGNIHDWGYPQLDPAIPVTPFELPLYMRNLY